MLYFTNVSKFCFSFYEKWKGVHTFLILITIKLALFSMMVLSPLIVLLVKCNKQQKPYKVVKIATFTICLKLKKLHSEIYCYQLVY